MSFCLAYMTFNHKDEAKNIACELLEKKLVSCVNIFPKIESYFIWEDEFSSEEEIVAIAKLVEKRSIRRQEKITGRNQFTCKACQQLTLSITTFRQKKMKRVS